PELVVRQPGDGAYLLGCQGADTPFSAAAAAAAAAAAVPSTILRRMSSFSTMTSGQLHSSGRPIPLELVGSMYDCCPNRLMPPYDAMAVPLGRQVLGSSPTPGIESVLSPGATNTCSEVGPDAVTEPCFGIQIASPLPYSSSPPAAASDCSNSSSLRQEWVVQASVSPVASTLPTQGLHSTYPAVSTNVAVSAPATTTSAAATAGTGSFQDWQSVRPAAETGFTVGYFPLPTGFQQSCVGGGIEALGLWSGFELH
ncbi:hypothetical protein Vafri_17556, partial [Volvox africanus]